MYPVNIIVSSRRSHPQRRESCRKGRSTSRGSSTSRKHHPPSLILRHDFSSGSASKQHLCRHLRPIWVDGSLHHVAETPRSIQSGPMWSREGSIASRIHVRLCHPISGFSGPRPTRSHWKTAPISEGLVYEPGSPAATMTSVLPPWSDFLDASHHCCLMDPTSASRTESTRNGSGSHIRGPQWSHASCPHHRRRVNLIG